MAVNVRRFVKLLLNGPDYKFRSEHAIEAKMLNEAGARISLVMGVVGSISIAFIIFGVLMLYGTGTGQASKIDTSSLLKILLKIIVEANALIYFLHIIVMRELRKVGRVMARIGGLEERDGRES